MVRIAAVGDIHLGTQARGTLRPALERIDEHADLLLLAGDLTNYGTPEEARVVAGEVADLPVPVVGVLGNHDHQDDRPGEVTAILRDHGVRMLEGEAVVLHVAGQRLGIAGAKGFGGGFAGKNGSAFGEREMKAFIDCSTAAADSLRTALDSLDAEHRIALMHYSPVPDTLRGEPPELFPFLGSYLLADAIDSADTELALHGHAHYGTEHGETAHGIPVRNVAQPVLQEPFRVYAVGESEDPVARAEVSASGAEPDRAVD